MSEFEKWQNKRMIKTIGYLNNHTAFKAGEKSGWKAALEWVLKNFHISPIGSKAIKKELEQLN